MSWQAIAYVASVAFMACTLCAALFVIIRETAARYSQIKGVIKAHLERGQNHAN